MMKAHITEIFSSLQGEGVCLGERQIFVRFAGCNLRCDYCDTPESLTTDGSKEMTVLEILWDVQRLNQEHTHKTVSLTGGEPLLQSAFLREFLPKLKAEGFRTHLETHGALPTFLKTVIDWCDIIAMDIKLPSAIREERWQEHEEFLILSKDKAFVKIVLTEQTKTPEIERALRLIRKTNPECPVILQLATSVREVQSPSFEQVMGWWELAKKELPQVVLRQQMHPVWGLR